MTLSPESKKRFRAIGHNLKPVVTIAGNGLSESVCAELERALHDHELIKVKLSIEDREDRKAVIDAVCQKLKAENVQTIGKVLLLFRASEKPKLNTSNIR